MMFHARKIRSGWNFGRDRTGGLPLYNVIQVRRPNGAEGAYRVLSARILDQYYKVGECIDIGPLVRELRIGPVHIRAALNRLKREGLITASTHRYLVMPIPDQRWFAELYEFRLALETWAAREVASHRPQATLARMRGTLALMDRSGAVNFDDYQGSHEADKIFHAALIEGTANRLAAMAHRNLNTHLHYARLYCQSPLPSNLALLEHQAILDAIERGDEDAAAEAMRTHLDGSRIRLGIAKPNSVNSLCWGPLAAAFGPSAAPEEVLHIDPIDPALIRSLLDSAHSAHRGRRA